MAILQAKRKIGDGKVEIVSCAGEDEIQSTRDGLGPRSECRGAHNVKNRWTVSGLQGIWATGGCGGQSASAIKSRSETAREGESRSDFPPKKGNYRHPPTKSEQKSSCREVCKKIFHIRAREEEGRGRGGGNITPLNP